MHPIFRHGIHGPVFNIIKIIFLNYELSFYYNVVRHHYNTNLKCYCIIVHAKLKIEPRTPHPGTHAFSVNCVREATPSLRSIMRAQPRLP